MIAVKGSRIAEPSALRRPRTSRTHSRSKGDRCTSTAPMRADIAESYSAGSHCGSPLNLVQTGGEGEVGDGELVALAITSRRTAPLRGALSTCCSSLAAYAPGFGDPASGWADSARSAPHRETSVNNIVVTHLPLCGVHAVEYRQSRLRWANPVIGTNRPDDHGMTSHPRGLDAGATSSVKVSDHY